MQWTTKAHDDDDVDADEMAISTTWLAPSTTGRERTPAQIRHKAAQEPKIDTTQASATFL
jgi:hypothetical protein